MSIGCGQPRLLEKNTSFCLHLLIDKQIQDAADAAAGCQLGRQPDHWGEPRKHQRLHVSPRESANNSLRNINWESHWNGFYRSFSSLHFIKHVNSDGPVSNMKKFLFEWIFTQICMFNLIGFFFSAAMEQHRITCEEEGRYVGKWFSCCNSLFHTSAWDFFNCYILWNFLL